MRACTNMSQLAEGIGRGGMHTKRSVSASVQFVPCSDNVSDISVPYGQIAGSGVLSQTRLKQEAAAPLGQWPKMKLHLATNDPDTGSPHQPI